MNPIKSLRIDGRPVVPRCFSSGHMSLSSARAGMVPHAFAITCDAALVAAAIGPAYAAWVVDARKDDALAGAPGDALGRAGYPELTDVLRVPALAGLLLGHYLLFDCLARFTWDGVAPVEYWLDDVTDCTVAGGDITLCGTCYSKPAG